MLNIFFTICPIIFHNSWHLVLSLNRPFVWKNSNCLPFGESLSKNAHVYIYFLKEGDLGLPTLVPETRTNWNPKNFAFILEPKKNFQNIKVLGAKILVQRNFCPQNNWVSQKSNEIKSIPAPTQLFWGCFVAVVVVYNIVDVFNFGASVRLSSGHRSGVAY